jgi:predicted RNase H-like HicB family nuclease
MAVPIFVDQDNGRFVASMVGWPEVCATAPTRDAALAELKTAIQHKLAQPDVELLEVERKGIMALAGKYRDDPTIADIRDEIYRERDAEPKE